MRDLLRRASDRSYLEVYQYFDKSGNSVKRATAKCPGLRCDFKIKTKLEYQAHLTSKASKNHREMLQAAQVCVLVI